MKDQYGRDVQVTPNGTKTEYHVYWEGQKQFQISLDSRDDSRALFICSGLAPLGARQQVPATFYLAGSFESLSSVPVWRAAVIAAGGSTSETWPDINPPDPSVPNFTSLVSFLVAQQGQEILSSLAVILCDASVDGLMAAQYAVSNGVPVIWATSMSFAAFQPNVKLFDSADHAFQSLPAIISKIQGLEDIREARAKILN